MGGYSRIVLAHFKIPTFKVPSLFTQKRHIYGPRPKKNPQRILTITDFRFGFEIRLYLSKFVQSEESVSLFTFRELLS